MNSARHFLFSIVQFFLVLLLLTQAQDQSGFISIDCGISGMSSYTDETTGISYSSDADFTETGENGDISPEYKSYADSQLLNVRSFPSGIRNCYTLKPKRGKGQKYLIRARFMYGNYDNNAQAPMFDLYLGPNLWDTVMAWNSWTIQYTEIIHIPLSDYINVCLVNIGHGIPFISALELRPIDGEIYLTPAHMSLQLYTRYYLSPATVQTMRFKDDRFDRFWEPVNWEPSINISTRDEDSITKNIYELPFTVLSTAYTNNTNATQAQINLPKFNSSLTYFFYMHFAELQKLQTNQTRQFNIYLNDDLWYGPVSPSYLDALSIFSGSDGNKPDSDGKITVWLMNTNSATLPPLINAMEIYILKELQQHETNQTDVEAISNVKLVYGLKKADWQGDPCVPITYQWGGLNCSFSSDNQPRIVSLTLSSSGLKGEIAPSIVNLSMLEHLDLSNNRLEGKVPEFLAHLPFLKVLNLEGNNFTEVPQALLSKKDIELRIDQYLCKNTSSCPSESRGKKTSYVIAVVASLSGVLFVVLITVVIIWYIKRRRKQNVTNIRAVETASVETLSAEQRISGEPREDDGPFESKNQQFTYTEITKITSNFQRVLGEGGFGKVYHGFLHGKEVAVKMLSSPSIQGHRQFHTELKLLLRVHHKNLTMLVGYCNEGTNIGLIYEYMALGNLRSHISGSRKSILSWEDRLRIAIDTAQGLEYLHNGCKPPIIHRDVKSTNILLSEKLQAKLGDFGLSKIFPLEGGNHITTTGTLGITTSIAGTPGYLDPEYYNTNWLNEKSDVYSFGVVLLEIITARPVLKKTRENGHIIQWVSSMLAMGDIENILDPRMEGLCDINTVWKVIEMAMACVLRSSTNRPTMSRVTVELKECLTLELARKNSHNTTDLSKDSSVEMISRIMVTEFSPDAR